MSIQTYARLLVVGGLVGTLACARNTSDEDVSARRDTTSVADTATVMQDSAGGQNQTPPGYSGMERDTTQFPERGDSATTQNMGQDTSAYQQQGQDTSAYQQQGQDTSAYQQQGQDTSAYQQGQDTSSYNQQGQTGEDTTGQYPGTDSTRIHTDSAHVNPPSGGWSDTTSDSSSWSTGRDSTPR